MTRPVIIVTLRQPKGEARWDPFYEFGSFGVTGCHCHSLLHPTKALSRKGHRLAFAQGGPEGFRLVLLTPPITVRPGKRYHEARWKRPPRPFKYADAPLLIDQKGDSDFPRLKAMAKPKGRTSWMGQFSSNFRTRARALDEHTSEEVLRIYRKYRRKAPRRKIAAVYYESMPSPPPDTNRNRREAYKVAREKAGIRCACTPPVSHARRRARAITA